MRVIANDIENVMDCSPVKMTASILADAVGVSVNTIRRIFKRRVETDFYTLLKLSNFLYPNDETLIKWCYTFERPINICAAMEYMALNNRFDVLKDYISEKSTNTLEKWGDIYTIIMDYTKNNLSDKEMLRKIERFPYGDSDIELINLLKLVKANTCFRIASPDSSYLCEMSRLCDEVEDSITNMKEGFLKESFNIRMNDLLGKRALYVRYNIEEARNYAYKNINQKICTFFKANSSYTVGRTFTFESYEKSVDYTEKAISEYKDAGFQRFADDLERYFLPFLNAYHGLGYSEGDFTGGAHYEAKWGNKKKAKRLLDEAVKREGESTYKMYYRGIANDDEDLLFEALSEFLYIGDKYSAQLPLEQLRKSEDPKTRKHAETLYKKFR